MKEKLRFRVISKLRLEQHLEGNQKEDSKSIESGKAIQRYIELLMYDILLEHFTLPVKFESLNTEMEEVAIKQITTPSFDVSIKGQTIEKQDQILVTNLTPVQIPRETFEIADISLFTATVNQTSTSLNTEVLKNIQTDKSKIASTVSHFDLKLGSKSLLKQTSELDTELVVTEVESGIESLRSSEGQIQLPFFEEFINCDKRFPRSFSESFNSPFIVLIGENEYEWHIPIIYSLKELFREITDKYPRITFREPEVWEEGREEHVDSLDPHSLDQFAFEYKIEFLDARKMRLAIDEFAKVVKGRLRSGFLQQLGVLVLAVKPEDLERAENSLKIEGLRIFTCKSNNAKYEEFCSKILGLSSLDKFFNNLKNYEKYLDYSNRRFSIFVKRGGNATDNADKLQYPLKVSTFISLLNEIRNRKKKIINNFEELCIFVNGILEKEEITVESKAKFNSPNEKPVIPDLIYSPESGSEIYIEIETLIGTFEPMKKVDETIEKYKNFPDATIWVVFKPISAMLHYEELKARKKAYGIFYGDKKIEFKVLTLLTSKEGFRWNLVTFDEFRRGKNAR